MPTKQQRLDELMREGMTVYPAGMNAVPRSWETGLGQLPRRIPGQMGQIRFVRTKSGEVWGGLGAIAQEQATERLLLWLQQRNPKLYAAVMRKMENNANANRRRAGLGQVKPTEELSWWQKTIETVKDLAPAYLIYQQEKQIMDIQVARAEQGLPPLETAEFSTTERAATAAGGEAGRQAVAALAQSPVVWIGGAALVMMMMMGGRKRRRA